MSSFAKLTVKVITIPLVMWSWLSSTAETLIFGVHPYMPTSEMQQAFSPLIQHLSYLIDKPIQLFIAKDYQAHIEAIGNNKLDIAFLGAQPYIKVVENYGERPIIGKLEINGSTTYRGVIVTSKDSKLNSISDITGRRFAFGDEHSTMSHIVPKYMLKKAGVSKQQLSGFEYLPNHSAIALAVLSGMFDAGAIKDSIFDIYKERGLRAIAWSKPISTHVFVTRKNMPEETVLKLRQAMLNLSTETYGSVILHAISTDATAIVSGKDSDFDNLRNMQSMVNKTGSSQ